MPVSWHVTSLASILVCKLGIKKNVILSLCKDDILFIRLFVLCFFDVLPFACRHPIATSSLLYVCLDEDVLQVVVIHEATQVGAVVDALDDAV